MELTEINRSIIKGQLINIFIVKIEAAVGFRSQS